MAEDKRPRPKMIAFDIIGTVFTMEPLRPKVEALGLPGAALEGWTAAADRDAASMAAAGDYRPFPEVSKAALDAVLAEQKLNPPASNKKALLDAMSDMSPREDTHEALKLAADAGIPVIALSNGSAEATRDLLDRAGVLGFFAQIVSTDEVQLAKPRGEVYRHAAEVAQLEPSQMALVAAHSWDIQGAVAAGWTTGYMNADRPYSTAMREPTIQSDTLTGCVRALAAMPG